MEKFEFSNKESIVNILDISHFNHYTSELSIELPSFTIKMGNVVYISL